MQKEMQKGSVGALFLAAWPVRCSRAGVLDVRTRASFFYYVRHIRRRQKCSHMYDISGIKIRLVRVCKELTSKVCRRLR
jgi:hypothetical protein